MLKLTRGFVAQVLRHSGWSTGFVPQQLRSPLERSSVLRGQQHRASFCQTPLFAPAGAGEHHVLQVMCAPPLPDNALLVGSPWLPVVRGEVRHHRFVEARPRRAAVACRAACRTAG